MANISVIVPVYNKEKEITITIDSVLSQTFADFELILVDDGSTDLSKDIISSYADNRIFYKYKENGGVSSAKNLGINVAKGEFITFLDAGDFWEKSFLEKMFNRIEDQDICYSGYKLYFSDGSSKEKKSKFYSGQIIKDYLLGKVSPHTNNWLIRRSFIEENNLKFDERFSLGEDMLFFSNLLLFTEKITFVNEYLNYYVQDHSGSLSSGKGIEKIEQDIAWINQLADDINKSNNDNKFKLDIIDSIYGYRLPALIIYRIINNMDKLTRDEISNVITNNREYIRRISFNNGLRSIKLFMNYLYLEIIDYIF